MKSSHLIACLAIVVTVFGRADLRAQTETYQAALSGPNESPSNASPGTGFATVTINPTTNILNVVVSFGGLIGTTTASHIHAATAVPFAGTAGVATATPTFPGFPLGVTSGSYAMSFDMSQASTWNLAFITANGGTAAGAEAAFIAAVRQGRSYLNIHTTSFSSGEIRGFLVAAPVPENGTNAILMLLAVGALLLARRHQSA